MSPPSSSEQDAVVSDNSPKIGRFEVPQANAQGLIPTLHNPGGIPKEDMFFDEEKVSSLILKWREEGDVTVWQQMVEATMPLIDTLILHGGFTDYDDMDCLRNECVIKLHKLALKFDPKRGRAFTIFSVSIKHFLISYVHKIHNKSRLVTCVDDEELEMVEATPYISHTISREFKSRILNIETRFMEVKQRDALKYLINYFLNEGFSTSKTKLCATMCLSFDLTADQAYLLYDYALMKLRSELYDLYEVKLSNVEIFRLNKRWSLIPEIAEVIGIPALNKLVTLFGGISITLPTPKDIQKLRFSAAVNTKAAEDSSVLSLKELADEIGGDTQSEFIRLGEEITKGRHATGPLYEEELALLKEHGEEQDS